MQIVLIPHDPAHAVFKCNKRMSLVLACQLAALIAEEDELNPDWEEATVSTRK